jgi:hypothetical protein
LTVGTNTLVGLDFAKASALIDRILTGQYKKSRPIPGWDGCAARRVVNAVADFFGS